MKKTLDVLERKDIFLISEQAGLNKFYENLKKVLVKLQFDQVIEEKGEFTPSKKKVKPKLKVVHKFDPYTQLELEIKFGVAKPLPTESRNPDIYKVTFDYKAEIVTTISEDFRFRRSEPFKKIYEFFHKRVYTNAALQEYKTYSEKLIFRIMNEARQMYGLPELFKELD